MRIFGESLDFIKSFLFFEPPLQADFSFNRALKSLDTSFFSDLLVTLVLTFIFLLIVYTLLRLLFIRWELKQKYILFEIRPLTETLQSPLSTQQLFNLIHGLAKQRSFFYKLFDSYKSYAFEIVSTKKEGIRYLLRINGEDAELVRKSLLSYLPGISINQVNDYLSKKFTSEQFKIVNFKQSSHFAYPLKKQKLLKEHDPIAYITGNMTKLDKGELISFQIIASPVNRRFKNQARTITRLISAKSDLAIGLKDMKAKYKLANLFRLLIRLIFYVFLIPVGFLVFLATGGKEGPFLHLEGLDKNKKASNAYQKELEKLIKDKLDQQLFKTSLRLLVVNSNRGKQNKRTRGFISALSSFRNSNYQSLVTFFNFKQDLIKKIKAYLFKNRLLGLFGNSVLSASEVADIYHLPFTLKTKTEDLVKQHSKQLPAPLSLKKTDNFDVIFAKNTYGGTVTKIGLTQDERRRHMYVLGATGTGKSTLLLSMILQDIKNKKGLCVIDPHGDLIDKILPAIPKDRASDVIYFNPDDVSYPIGLNLLELTPGLNEDDALREKEFLTESIISLFHKIYSERYSGPRMEYILRNTIHTAFTTEKPTLFTIYKLLIDTTYRKKIVWGLDDEDLKDFWRYEFAKAGNYQRVKMISPITNKIGRFLFSPIAKRILEQEKSSINFDEILSSGKILLCNVSKGRIGEDSSEVFGILIMTKIQLAALKRARVADKDRKDFYLYVDEFQSFATTAFAEILSEARKYRLNAVMAHQTTSQLKDKSLVNVILANTGTVICFRTANPEDERLILPQFSPYIEKGEIASLPSFNFYIKISALNPEEPFSGVTTPVTTSLNNERKNQIIKLSRKLYTVPYKRQPAKSKKMDKALQPKLIAEVQPGSIMP
ncbi:MAG TPA: type IV secretion system DNA-binding domain-containing protein [Nevskiaceae bacterium]|nr:type IV secretion system DNA-binding domain-containing protein [Nevskiaceae bacterium]